MASFDRLTGSTTGFTVGTNGSVSNTCASTGSPTYSTLPPSSLVSQTIDYPVFCVVAAPGGGHVRRLHDLVGGDGDLPRCGIDSDADRHGDAHQYANRNSDSQTDADRHGDAHQ